MFRTLRRSIGLVPALLALSLSHGLHAQAPIVEEPGYTPSLTFDVASIRQAPPPTGNFHVSVSSPAHSSRFEATNLPLKSLIQIAYGFEEPIAGAPEWISSTFYTLEARSDEAADARLAKLSDNEVRLEKRNAIRVLLAERLQLKTHTETRATSIYELVVGRNGVKMQAVVVPPAAADGDTPPPAPVATIQTRRAPQGLEFTGGDASMRAITGALSAMLETPVLDRTGLTGMYNFTLQFGREETASDAESWPSLFTAIQEQLGLKLQPVREAVPNLVIDRITRPTEN